MAFIPIIVSIIGLLIFGISENAKMQSIGNVMFWTGLLVFLFQCASLKFPLA